MKNEIYKKVVDIINVKFNLDGKLKCLGGDSIYKYSPVFISMYNGEKIIIKKTKAKYDNANELFRWEKELEDHGVECVSPIKASNSEVITCVPKDERWVLYPYIDGEKFDGSLDHIRNAGRVLGKIHKAGDKKRFLKSEFKFESFDNEFINEVNEELKVIKRRYKDVFSLETLQKFQRWIQDAIEANYNDLYKR